MFADFMQKLSKLLLIAIAIGLSGCGNGDHYERMAKLKVDTDPYEAALLLKKSDAEHANYCFWSGCTKEEHIHRYYLLRARYQLLLDAVRAGDYRAIDTIFEDSSIPAEIRNQARSLVSEVADKADAPSSVLKIAGNSVDDDRRRFSYYSRAWLKGDLDAAYRLQQLFEGSNDVANSYLWQLRCGRRCEWIDPDPKKLLTPSQKASIQLEAKGNKLQVNSIDDVIY